MPLTLLRAGRLVALLLILWPLASADAQVVKYRVNAGGPAFRDAQNDLWRRDDGFFTTGVAIRRQSLGGGAVSDPLYHSERYDPPQAPEMGYRFPVPPGIYQVRLHFSEIRPRFGAIGARVFDVALEGQVLLPALDIFALVGFDTPLVQQLDDVRVDDQMLEIDFTRLVGDPKISGIEIIQTQEFVGDLEATPTQLDFGGIFQGNSSAPQDVTLRNNGELTLTVRDLVVADAENWQVSGVTAPFPLAPQAEVTVQVTFSPNVIGDLPSTLTFSWDDFQTTSGVSGEVVVALDGTGREPLPDYQVDLRVNAGGGDLTDGGGNLWLSDHRYANTGYTLDLGAIGPAARDIYQSDRLDPTFAPDLAYRFVVEPGEYVVRLHFYERRSPTLGARVFDVSAEGNLLLDDYDIFRWAGYKTPIVEEYAVSVFDGMLDLQFGHEVDAPVISGIEFGLARPFHGEIEAAPSAVSFVDVNVGDQSAPVPVQLRNVGEIDLTITNVLTSDLAEFPATLQDNLPIVLGPNETTWLDVTFVPQGNGQRLGDLTILSDDPDGDLIIPLDGFGTIPQDPVTIYRVNAGGNNYTDPSSNLWVNDSGFYNTGSTSSTGSPIENTELDPLYQNERWDSAGAPPMTYTFPLSPGRYLVRLHFAEIFHNNPGNRIFDVKLEDQLVLDDLDVFAQAGGKLRALVIELEQLVLDGALEVSFWHVANNPQISAFEIALLAPLAQLDTSPTSLDFGHIKTGEISTPRSFTLSNPGPATVQLSGITFHIEEGGAQDFIATVEGTPYVGAPQDVTYPLDIDLRPGGSLDIPVVFQPTSEQENSFEIDFEGAFDVTPVHLHGAGGEGHPYLHVVILVAPYTVDYDQDSQAPVELIGSDSHTHEVGHVLAAFEWAEVGVPFAQIDNVITPFALGEHSVTLTIWDDNQPPESLTGGLTFRVVSPNEVPGVLVQYYDASGPGPDALLDSLPPNADWGELKDALLIDDSVDPFSGQLVVQFLSQIDLATSDTYDFQVIAGGNFRLTLDGLPVTGPQIVNAGRHALEARFAVNTWADLPLEVTMGVAGGPQQSIDSALITHDQTTMLPVVNTYPVEGLPQGGYAATLTGLGFFPSDQVVVHWGNEMITVPALAAEPDQLDFIVPPGIGTINVHVTTPNGSSNSFQFTYTDTGPPPVDFEVTELVQTTNPTAIAWGPDGRLYVANVYGEIKAYSFDDDYNITGTQAIGTIAGLTNTTILGLAFNPHEDSAPVRLYVAHNQIYANGGTCFEGFSPYSGQISVLTGPNFDVVLPVVTGLPVSNHDHAINGIAFDNAGDLLILSGANTNAGVSACPHGGLDESPLSACLMKAWITRQNFNGVVTYVETVSGQPNDNQSDGGIVDVAPGVDVEVFAPGLRNPFDLVYTTWEAIYATDNGANAAFGPRSTGPDTEDEGPTDWDELLLVEFGNYYGMPNRNRGRTDARQNVFHWTWEDPIPGVYTSPLSTFHSSTDGILEYRATTFQSALRGSLLAQKWNGQTYRIELTPDKMGVSSQSNLPATIKGLDLVQVPGGVLVASDYSGSRLVIARPVDITLFGFAALDVFPWRAASTGGNTFVIAGAGFGDLQTTSVTFGGLAATLTEVTDTRIRGIIPANPSPTSTLVDVSVMIGGESRTIPAAFRWLF